MKSGNQVQICVKLDQSAYSHLVLENAVTGVPSNRIINWSIIAYCQAIDIARGVKAGIYGEKQAAGWFLKALAPWILHPQRTSFTLRKIQELE